MEDQIEIEPTHDKGFSLVELLIVIVILGILATVVVFAVTGMSNRGKTNACKSDLHILQTAEEAYAANTGVYATGATAQQTLKDSGLLHDVSTNFRVDPVAATSTTPASYSLQGISTDCATFTG